MSDEKTNPDQKLIGTEVDSEGVSVSPIIAVYELYDDSVSPRINYSMLVRSDGTYEQYMEGGLLVKKGLWSEVEVERQGPLENDEDVD